MRHQYCKSLARSGARSPGPALMQLFCAAGCTAKTNGAHTHSENMWTATHTWKHSQRGIGAKTSPVFMFTFTQILNFLPLESTYMRSMHLSNKHFKISWINNAITHIHRPLSPSPCYHLYLSSATRMGKRHKWKRVIVQGRHYSSAEPGPGCTGVEEHNVNSIRLWVI